MNAGCPGLHLVRLFGRITVWDIVAGGDAFALPAGREGRKP